MTSTEKTPVATDAPSRYFQAMRSVADTLYPGQNAAALLSRIQWLAAAQDGTFDTAQEALFQIEDLAAEAISTLSPSSSL